jgi:predicted ribonuclease YlaK
VSRLGYGSKAILLGDPDQFDNPCCSRDINGLTAAIHHFIEKPHSFLINLNRNFRSQVSRDTLDWNVYSG